MLESLFGNPTVERVLLYLQNYDEGYATEIAATFSTSLSVVPSLYVEPAISVSQRAPSATGKIL